MLRAVVHATYERHTHTHSFIQQPVINETKHRQNLWWSLVGNDANQRDIMKLQIRVRANRMGIAEVTESGMFLFFA